MKALRRDPKLRRRRCRLFPDVQFLATSEARRPLRGDGRRVGRLGKSWRAPLGILHFRKLSGAEQDPASPRLP